ncbi:YlmC/YmxH family sporulation protein [Viridibacillus arvi]|uniref:YlmC/YmxH family sporulation protein n=1 Tax=Viridibacillus arvi TaxID=263475 RepID=UPI003809380B
MLLSELAEKELIQMNDGIRFGILAETECLFDPKTGQIFGFEMIHRGHRIPFKAKSPKMQEYIPWDEIVLIGEDRILFNQVKPMNSGLTE